MRRARLLLGLTVAVAPLLVVLAPAYPASAAVSTPTVEGPIPGAAAGSAAYDVTGAGYVEQEFFVSGTAKTYTEPVTTAPFKIRILVYRPTQAKNFNGTAIAEWENVTGQIPGGHPMFSWLHHFAIREGYVYVQVAAQEVPAGQGGLGYQVYSSRYADYAHPGDEYSFDIYSQAMRALNVRKGVSPVGNLNPRYQIAIGNSQSASRLHSYIQLAQDDAGIADAFLLDAGGAKTFPKKPQVPTIHLLSEDGFSAAAPNVTNKYRLWEVAGASHNDADETRHLHVVTLPGETKQTWAEHDEFDRNRHYGEEGLTQHATCVLGAGGNEFPRRFAVNAAVHYLDRWIRTGTPASQPPRVKYAANGDPVKDTHNNTVGGLRLPPIDVPVATYFGDACLLFGMNVPLSPPTLSQLYPTHKDYVVKMQAATTFSVVKRWLLAEDGCDLMRLAVKSTIGGSDIYSPKIPQCVLAGSQGRVTPGSGLDEGSNTGGSGEGLATTGPQLPYAPLGLLLAAGALIFIRHTRRSRSSAAAG